MRIIVTGGTGFIGHALVRTLSQDGHAVSVLTRRAGPAKKIVGAARVVEWNPMASGSWEQEFSGVDAVINLAGRTDCGRSLDRVPETQHYSEPDRRDESDRRGIARELHNALYLNQCVGYRLLRTEQRSFNI